MKRFTTQEFQRIEKALEEKLSYATEPISHSQIANFFSKANIIFQVEKLRNVNIPLSYDLELESIDISEDELTKLNKAEYPTHRASNFLKTRKELTEKLRKLRGIEPEDSEISSSSKLFSSSKKIQKAEYHSPVKTERNNLGGNQIQKVALNDLYTHMTKDKEKLQTSNLLESIGILAVCQMLKTLPGYNMMNIVESTMKH